MTEDEDTTDGEPRKTWQERNAEAKTKAGAVKTRLEAKLAAEWQAADEQIARALQGTKETRALELTTRALERWSRESRGIPPKQYATWVRDADVAQPVATSDELVGRASNENETPESQMQAREKAESLALDVRCHDLDTLKPRTRAVCAHKFAVFAGCEWEDLPKWARCTIEQCWVHDNQKVEREAADALEALRSALLALRAVPSEGGAVRAHFARRLAEHLRSDDLTAVVEYSPKDPLDINTMGLGTINFRQKLAVFWTLAPPYLREKRDAIAQPYPPEVEASRPLASADELAVVAILAGDWPDKMQPDWEKGVTPGAIIDSVKGGFAAANGALSRARSLIAAGRRFIE